MIISIPPEVRKQRERLNDILRRHVRVEDADKTDTVFVKAVLQRFQYERGLVLVDPAE